MNGRPRSRRARPRYDESGRLGGHFVLRQSLLLTLGAKQQGAGMPKGFIVLTGTGIGESREWAPSATDALRLIREHMKLRRPGVRVEDEYGKIP
jgi:hypothetical protein